MRRKEAADIPSGAGYTARTLEAQRRAQQGPVEPLVKAVARHERRRCRCIGESRVVVHAQVVLEPHLGKAIGNWLVLAR